MANMAADGNKGRVPGLLFVKALESLKKPEARANGAPPGDSDSAVRFGCFEDEPTIADINDGSLTPVSVKELSSPGDTGACDCSTACTSETEAVLPAQSQPQRGESQSGINKDCKYPPGQWTVTKPQNGTIPGFPPGKWGELKIRTNSDDTRPVEDFPPGTPEPGTPEWSPRCPQMHTEPEMCAQAQFLAQTQQVLQAPVVAQSSVAGLVGLAAPPPPADHCVWYRVAYLGGIELRTEPSHWAPRTGITLHQNETFPVSQEVNGADGRIYLLVGDGRGWAFDDAALIPHDPSVVRGAWTAPSTPAMAQQSPHFSHILPLTEPVADGYGPPCAMGPPSLSTAAPTSPYGPPPHPQLTYSVAQAQPLADPMQWYSQPSYESAAAGCMQYQW